MSTELLRHVCPSFARRRRGTLPRLFVALLAVATVLAARPARSVMADNLCIVGQPGCGPVIYPPAPLLDLSQPLYTATSAQAASLLVLENQAIANTIADHGLAAGDGDTVRSWGRDDADAELWGLLVQAINASPRSTDQQNAVDWLTTVLQREGVQAADDAGFEFAKWAGFDQNYYQNNVDSLTQNQLTQYFNSGTPVAYNLINSQGQPINAGGPGSFNVQAALQSTGGYCVYGPPSPYGSDLSNSSNQTCYGGCTDFFTNCAVTYPTYDQLVKWGGADVNNALFNSTQFAQVSRGVAYGLAFGGAVVAAGITGAVLSSALAGVLVGSALQTAIFPFLAIPLSQSVIPGALSAAGAAELAGGVTAAAVGFVVAVVIAAIAIAVIEGINVITSGQAQAALPGQLASLIVGARANTPDLTKILADSSKAGGLYSLFIGATLPSPTLQSCDNSQAFIGLTGANGQLVVAAPTPCLNATAIPAPANLDPEFAVTGKGAPSSTTTDASSITLKDTTTKVTDTARVTDGHWFVNQVTDSAGTTATYQSLRLEYTDWSGNEQTVWVLGDATSGYTFLTIADIASQASSFDPSKCLSAGTCSSSSTIQYVGADGNDYSASLVPAQVPAVNPSVSANPLEGSPVNFTANGSSPSGLALTDQWQFEQPSQSITICTQPPCSLYNYTAPVSGATASYTWTTSGTYHVQLTATDSAGKYTVDTFTVNIGDVPPTLTLDPNNSYTVPVGAVTTLGGTVVHAGSSDAETVDVNWGDGSPDHSSTVGCPGGICILSLNPISSITSSGLTITLSDTHTYAKPGSYTATVTVTDQAGGTATKTVTEVAQAAQAITFAPIPTHTYGDAFAVSATGGGSGKAVTFTSTDPTVCTVSGATSGTDAGGNGTGGATVTLVKAGTCTITANQAGTTNPAGTAIYTPAPPVPQSFTVQPAPLTITAGNATTPYGKVPPFTWTGSPWVNGDSSSTLATAPNSAPTCGAAVNGSAESATTPPGIYPGAITCQGAVDPNYTFTYLSGALTINPLISLDEQGLPSTVPHQATLDGTTVSLPDLNVVVPYGSSHGYHFPATVTDRSGTVYITNDVGFSGAVTANLSDTAVYRTISQIVGAALAGGGINDGGIAGSLTQQFNAVQADIAAGNTSQALADLHSFAAHVRAQSGQHISTATANTLLADAQLVYASLGGTGAV